MPVIVTEEEIESSLQERFKKREAISSLALEASDLYLRLDNLIDDSDLKDYHPSPNMFSNMIGPCVLAPLEDTKTDRGKLLD